LTDIRAAVVSLNLTDSDEGTDGILDFAQERLKAFNFYDKESRIDKCDVTFRNADKSLLDEPRLKSGQEYLVQWGYPNRMSDVYRMIVKRSKEAGTDLTVTMKGKAVLLDDGKKYRQWVGVRDSDVVSEIFQEYGFQGATLDVIETTVYRGTITQATSDARFIQHLAKRNGFQWWIDGSGAHFRPRSKDVEPYKWYTYRGHFTGDGEILEPGPTIDANFSNDIARVKVKAIDPYTLQEVIAEQGISGGDAEEDFEVSLGSEQEVGDPDALDGYRQKRVTRAEEINIGFATQSEVAAKAEAIYREVASRRYKMTMPIVGDPDIHARMLIGLRNYSEAYSGLYYIKSVVHQISGGRYRCELETVRDALGKIYLKKKLGVSGKKNSNEDPGGADGPPKPDKLQRITTTKKGPNNTDIWIHQWVKPGTSTVVKEEVLSDVMQQRLDGLK